MRTTWLIGLALLVGCGTAEPKKIEVKINGQAVPLVQHKKENDPAKAAEQLAKAKAKWLDEAGELQEKYRKGTSNKAMATMEIEAVAFNHPETPAAQEAKAILEKLSR
jgi:hypothetical protein